jgi:high-affinity K+ transport system ATPase subunit B
MADVDTLIVDKNGTLTMGTDGTNIVTSAMSLN